MRFWTVMCYLDYNVGVNTQCSLQMMRLFVQRIVSTPIQALRPGWRCALLTLAKLDVSQLRWNDS